MNAIIPLLLALTVLGGPTDWVAPEYVEWSSSNSAGPGSATYDSQNAIIQAAQSYAKIGPWSVTYTDIYPPSNDTRDYLSWAPYHWPNCNWCNEGDNSHGVSNAPQSKGSPDSDSGSGDEYSRQPRRLKRVYRRRDLFEEETPVYAIPMISDSETPQVSYPMAIPAPNVAHATTNSNADSPTDASYQKTSVSKPSATKTSKTSCTPSPTTYMAPSATWTTCQYVPRDGSVNPDVRSLRPPGAFNTVSEAVVFNAIAYVLTRTSRYSQTVAGLIKTFFLDNVTGMNPNLNFGQVIRGPGVSGRSGTFTGILDARGMVKIANAIGIIRSANSSDWSALDSQMMKWANEYVSWLINSPSGKKAASRPNNHATFYTLQLASIQLLIGDYDGASGTVNNFVEKIFPDQIARSGEQPFEAVRTRPFHYRCFNLEALIALAKLCEKLKNCNLWSRQSKNSATIQDALDHTMTIDPGKENAQELAPHVAAVAAAYGDPTGKYVKYLAKTDGAYRSKPYWFFDQPTAMRGAKKGQKVEIIEGMLGDILFDCPAVFSEVSAVELDNGVFVTCEQLRPFYEL